MFPLAAKDGNGMQKMARPCKSLKCLEISKQIPTSQFPPFDPSISLSRSAAASCPRSFSGTSFSSQRCRSAGGPRPRGAWPLGALRRSGSGAGAVAGFSSQWELPGGRVYWNFDGVMAEKCWNRPNFWVGDVIVTYCNNVRHFLTTRD